MSEYSMSSMVIDQAYIAVNRFGYGAKDKELVNAFAKPQNWILSTLLPISFSKKLPGSKDVLSDHATYQQHKKKLKKQKSQSEKLKIKTDMKMLKNNARNTLKVLSGDILVHAINSDNSVSWRLLDFFSNHFSVTSSGRLMTGLAATLERESIAPYLLGNFNDMLLAVIQHPAMLIYLNNEKSIGPNSKVGKKRKKGLNENLAREIMELHTLGVNGDYNQADVIELAKAITGWSVHKSTSHDDSGFVFQSKFHEPGTRTLLNKNYSQSGVNQGKKILIDLAMMPATARHICYKLAHHFVSQTPTDSLLQKMETTWLTTNGNIKAVMYSMFRAQEAWLSHHQKFKTPREFLISTYRALGLSTSNSKFLLSSLSKLGHQPFNAGSPAGFSDDEKDWLGASGLMARIDWISRMSGDFKNINVEKIMKIALAGAVSMNTYQLVLRAESREQAMALLLMSPEFQRR